jgi:hypothetical protein
MIEDDRLPLREVARRLTAYSRFQKTTTGGKQELLKLLQQDQIRATFDFPSKARPRILIPAQFWIDIPSGRFQSQLNWSRQRGRHRQFMIDPAELSEHYVVGFVRSHVDEKVGPELSHEISAELISAFAGMRRKKEVYVLESEWARFLKDAELDSIEHRNEPKSSRGRSPLASWNVVLIEVAAEMLRRQARGKPLRNERSNIAQTALAKAQKKIPEWDLPKTDTIVKKVNAILEIMDASSDDS